jgi:hypothetical protein
LGTERCFLPGGSCVSRSGGLDDKFAWVLFFDLVTGDGRDGVDLERVWCGFVTSRGFLTGRGGGGIARESRLFGDSLDGLATPRALLIGRGGGGIARESRSLEGASSDLATPGGFFTGRGGGGIARDGILLGIAFWDLATCRVLLAGGGGGGIARDGKPFGAAVGAFATSRGSFAEGNGGSVARASRDRSLLGIAFCDFATCRRLLEGGGGDNERTGRLFERLV